MTRTLALLVVLAAAGTGCGVVDHAIADYVIERQERVKTYEGIYAEKGSIPGAPDTVVRGRVRFAAPSDFVAEVLEPEQYRGDAVAYTGSDLWLYSARTHSGVHVAHVPWSQQRWRDWMFESVRANRAAYDFTADDETVNVANRVARRWRVEPREDGLGASRIWLDEEFTTTLRLDAASYSFRFETVAFNRPLVAPPFDPPADAAWFEWDMGAPSVSMEELHEFAHFPILEPRDPRGLERTRAIWPKTDVAPILALYYEKGPLYASVAELRDDGAFDPHARGVDVDLGDTKGRLASIGWMSILWFSRSGVEVSIISNLPLHELVAFARSLEEN